MTDSTTRAALRVRPPWISVSQVLPVLVFGACLLDAWARTGSGPLPAWWLDAAALLSLAWALGTSAARRAWAVWATPFDGRILAAVAIAILQALPSFWGGDGLRWLSQMLACAVCYYALVVRSRARAGTADAMWRTFAAACVVLGGQAMLAATVSLVRLRAETQAVDLAWGAHHGLAKALLFVTVLTLGRASENGASSAWRVAAFFGIVGCLLHTVAGGFGLDPGSLGRLDEPLYFSATAVLLLMLFGLARMAWDVRRTRAHEARRWRALAGGFTLLAIFGLFGQTSGGEGVRALAVLAAVTAIAAHTAPADVVPRTAGASRAEDEPLARAA